MRSLRLATFLNALLGSCCLPFKILNFHDWALTNVRIATGFKTIPIGIYRFATADSISCAEAGPFE